jgi:hypothetical protein
MQLKVLILVLVTTIALSSGCATQSTLRGDLEVSGPTLVATGPVRGHLSAQSDQPIAVYLVRGQDCGDVKAIVTSVEQVRSTKFEAHVGESVCVSSYRVRERVTFHAERP